MKQYLNLMQNVLDNGEEKENRTGTNTLSVFGRQLRFDLRKGFPLLTTKKVHWKSVVHELLWFISGDTNTKYLRDNGVTIWDEWADEQGNLGPVYGAQWRKWPKDIYTNEWGEPARKGEAAGLIYKTRTKYIDQLQDLIHTLKINPQSRRHIVSAWNPNYIPDETISPQENVALGRMALAPCHMMFQLYVSDDGYIDLLMYQRSVDVFLGLPFNIASYALLLTMISLVTYTSPRYLIWTGGDVHLYTNHLDQARLQLQRQPRELPLLGYVPNPAPHVRGIDAFKYEDFMLTGYDPHPHIKAEISI